ncbi:MAG: hypothetical protein ACRET4_10545 [Steroidobacteraceae bacterium]
MLECAQSVAFDENAGPDFAHRIIALIDFDRPATHRQRDRCAQARYTGTTNDCFAHDRKSLLGRNETLSYVDLLEVQRHSAREAGFSGIGALRRKERRQAPPFGQFLTRKN